MQQAQSYLAGMANPFENVLQSYDSGLQTRSYRDKMQAEQAEQARKLQAQQELEQIDWNDQSAVARIVAQYPEYTKGAKDYYDQMEVKEQQEMLADMSKSISALSGSRPDVAIQRMREKAQVYNDMNMPDKAEEYSEMAEWMTRDPVSARKHLQMNYSLLAGKDVASAFGTYSDIDIAEAKLPSEIGAIQATTGKTNADAVKTNAESTETINKGIAQAAASLDPQTFSSSIARLYNAGQLTDEQFQDLQGMMQGTPEEVMHNLQSLAKQDSDYVRAYKPEIDVVDSGGYKNLVEYDPQTGEVITKGTIQNTVAPNQQYSSDTNLQIAGINQDGANQRAKLAAATSRYTSDQQTFAKLKGIDLQDKQATAKLNFAYQQEDVESKKAKLETYGGKVYAVYSDGTYTPAIGENGKQLTNTKNDSSTRKAVAEQQSMVDGGNELLRVLKKAKTLSNQGIYFGSTANARAGAASMVKGGTETSKRTQEYTTLITNSALQSMKSIFGGNPTEGERAILLKIQASTDYPREVREKILNEAIAAANNRIKSNQKQISTLQGGGGKPASTKTNYGSVIEPIKK